MNMPISQKLTGHPTGFDSTSLEKVSLEYQPDIPPKLLGKVTIENDTNCVHCDPTTLIARAKLSRIQQGLRNECAGQPLHLELTGQRQTKAPQRAAELAIQLPAEDDTMTLSVYLDLEALGIIYQATEFEVAVTLFTVDQQKQLQQQVSHHFALEVVANKMQSTLQLSFQDQLTPFGQQLRNITTTDATLAFDQRYAVLENSVDSKQIVKFELRNSAIIGDQPEPNNVVIIKKVWLEGFDDHQLLLLYGYEYGFDRQNPEKRRTLAIQGVANPLILKPDANHSLEMQINMLVNVPSQLYDNGVLTDSLNIEYQTWNAQTATYQTHISVINLNIPLRREYTSSVIAIDFGTTALCAAHKMPALDDNEAVPLGELWRNVYPDPIDTPREKSNILISSELYCRAQDLQSREINFAPPARMDMVLEQSDTPLVHNNSCYWMPNLKAHIAASHSDYKVGKGLSFSVADLVEQFYQRLARDYLTQLVRDDHGPGGEYRRVVLTHPNSYVDGQQAFLYDAVNSVFPNAQIRAMSESDAVIYYYLRHGMNTVISNTNPFKNAENILCFDMGGGTLDLSLRRVEFEAVEGIKVPKLTAQSGELIAMVSVAGAGNRLNELIAQVLDESLTRLEAWHKTQVEEGLLAEDDVVLMPRFKRIADQTKEYAQQDGLRRIAEAIQLQKIQLVNSPEGARSVDIRLPKTAEQADYSFAQVSRNAVKLLAEIEAPPCRIQLQSGSVVISLTMADIQQKLLKSFYPEHIYQPLKAVLYDANAQKITVDTLLISGRSMLFPGIKEQLLEHFEKYQPAPVVWSAVTPTQKRDGEQSHESLKSIVVLGALSWGREAMTGDELFNPPKLLGQVGIAVRRKNGHWQWHPMFNEADIQLSEGQRKPKRVEDLDVRVLDEIVILQSFIHDSAQVSDEWLNVYSKNSEPAAATIKRLSECGYFRVMYHHQNMPALRNLVQQKMALQLMLYTAEEREAMPRHQQNLNDFANLEMELTIHNYRDGKVGQGGDGLVSREMRPKHLNRIAMHWPHSLYIQKSANREV